MNPVLVAGGATVMTFTGGFAALRAGKYRHLILGLAAGLMLGVVGFDLLPEALQNAPPTVLSTPLPLLLFVAGFLLLHVVERAVAIHRAHEDAYKSHQHQQAIGMFTASALVFHSVLDGFALGLAFQASTATGVAVAVAVISHDFADGFNTYTITTLYGNDRKRALLLLSADAVAPLAGATISLLTAIPASSVDAYLGFFAGVLLYLATADVLPEAHSPRSSGLTLVFTIAGAAIMFAIVGIAHQ